MKQERNTFEKILPERKKGRKEERRIEELKQEVQKEIT
jgi:hypothetical protein